MQADYSIPQRKEKNGVVPKGADGEDLGVGKGWWYEGNYCTNPISLLFYLPPTPRDLSS